MVFGKRLARTSDNLPPGIPKPLARRVTDTSTSARKNYSSLIFDHFSFLFTSYKLAVTVAGHHLPQKPLGFCGQCVCPFLIILRSGL